MSVPVDKTVLRRVRGGEQELVTTVSVAEGDTIPLESPIAHIRAKSAYRYGDYCWELVAALLSDAAASQRYTKAKLHVTEQLQFPDDDVIESALLKALGKSRQMIRQLHWNVATNNVSVVNESFVPVGYAVYEKLSRADHSCAPSARIVSADSMLGESKLIALRDLRAGQAVTWNYFQQDSSFASYGWMQRCLGTMNAFRFGCMCSRCQAEMSPQERALYPTQRALERFLDDALKESALGMMGRPEQVAAMFASEPMQMHGAMRKKHGLD